MLTRQNSLPPLAGLYALLAIVAILSYPNRVSAQQASPVASQLTAPELTATATAGAVELSWEAVQDAARYELSTWWNADTGWQSLGGDTLTGTSFTHTTVTAGTTYYYSIRAVNAAGQPSDWLEPYPSATVPVGSGTPPATPELTAAAAVGAVELSWEAVQDAARYELSAWWNADTGWQQLGGDNLTGTSFTHTTVTAGTTYYYSIRAVNASGQTSDWLHPYPSATVPEPSEGPGAAADRAALVALYNSADGPNWTRSDNWMSDKPLGEWHGVTADEDGRVTNLDLWQNNLSGTIPSDLGNLANLKGLNLGSNLLSGAIPSELGNLVNMTTLTLGQNNLSGPIPTELGNLANLTELNLAFGQLSGSIPTELGNLVNLTTLTLSRNKLSGTIPTELGNLVNLTTLTISINEVSGPIPTELGNLTNLTTLGLEGNRLTGPIPTELGNLANLTTLSLWGSRLSGPIPTELGNLTNLKILYLGSNQLSGTIPTELGKLTNLTSLRLHYNGLSGPIPTELGNLVNLKELRISQNQLTGCVPAPWQSVPVNDLDKLGLPFCTVAAPPATPKLTATAVFGAVELSWEEVQDAARYELFTWWDKDTGWQQIGGDNLTGTSFTHTTVTAGTTYYYSIRAVNADGQTSDWLQPYPSATVPEPLAGPDAAAQRAALVALYNATDGPNWTRSDNWLSAKPLGEWYGVATDAVGRVTELKLPDTGLSGPIPILSALSNLTELDLSNNQLRGSIPDLSALTNLEWLSLSGNQLSGSIPDLSALSNLTFLFLRDNQLNGRIPDLSALTNMTYLELSTNQLNGPIPDLSALTSLTNLELSTNQLDGPIPDLSALTNLTDLNLSNNQLSGPLPDLSTLSNLRYLDLGFNQMNGPLPDLSTLSHLRYLELAGNQLSGIIPDLSALSDLYYLGLGGNQLTGQIPDLSALSNLTYLGGASQIWG